MATDLGEKILRRLDELDMSQARLARLIGETPVRVHKWLHGTGHPKPDDLVAISRALELPLEYLADSRLDDPSGLIFLNEDERAVISLYRALDLGRREALRRLARPVESNPSPATAGGVTQPVRPPAGPRHPDGLSAPGREPPAAPPPRRKSK